MCGLMSVLSVLAPSRHEESERNAFQIPPPPEVLVKRVARSTAARLLLTALLPCVAFTAIASAQTLPELLGRRDSSRLDQFRSGDFSALLQHNVLVIIDPACDCPFPNNVIPRSRLLPNGAWPEDIFRANEEKLDSQLLEVAQGYTPLIRALDRAHASSPVTSLMHPRGHLHPGWLEWLLDSRTRAEVNGRLVNTEGSFRRRQAGWTALHYAASKSQPPEIVQLLLDSGASVNAPDGRGWTPLLLARSLESFKTLQAAGADIRARLDSGFTVLHRAASVTDATTVEALIAAGLDPNAETSSGWTPLLYAGSRESFEALLAGGADLGPIAAVFAPDGLEAVRRGDIPSAILSRAVSQIGRFASASLVARLRAINPGFAEVPNRLRIRSPQYPLHYTARWNEDPAMIAALSTTNVNATTWSLEGTPLALAAHYGNLAFIEATLATEVDVDAHGFEFAVPTPLYLAAASSSPRAAEIVGVLLGAGATVNARYSFPPLYAAAMAQNLAAMELLIAAGGDVNEAFVADFGSSLLATVLERGRFDCGYAPVAEVLHTAGAESVWWDRSLAGTNPDGSNRYTNTPHPYVPGPPVAECETVSEKVQELIDSGADLDALDSQGFTCLHLSAADGKAVDVTALAMAGANVNAMTRGGRLTPLHVAIWKRAGLATVRALIAAEADVNATDWMDQTALHRAARDSRADPAIVEALLAAGADPNARDSNWRMPLDYATRVDVNNEPVADLLRDAGGTCRSCDSP